MGHYDNATTELPDIPSRDPELLPSMLTYVQRKLLVQKGPLQPELSSYPRNKSILAGKQAQFSSKWYLIHSHLEYSIVKDATFCFVCSLFRKPTAEEAWSISSISAWHKMKSKVKKKRRRKLSEHFTSQEHRNALKDYARFCDPLCRIIIIIIIIYFAYKQQGF